MISRQCILSIVVFSVNTYKPFSKVDATVLVLSKINAIIARHCSLVFHLRIPTTWVPSNPLSFFNLPRWKMREEKMFWLFVSAVCFCFFYHGRTITANASTLNNAYIKPNEPKHEIRGRWVGAHLLSHVEGSCFQQPLLLQQTGIRSQSRQNLCEYQTSWRPPLFPSSQRDNFRQPTTSN